MEINIVKQKENPLFNRKEIQLEVKAQITPSRSEIEKIISEKFSTSTENIKINKIEGKFGSKIFTINANIYNSKEDKDKIEIKKKKEIEAEKRFQESEIKEENNQPKEDKTEVESKITSDESLATKDNPKPLDKAKE